MNETVRESTSSTATWRPPSSWHKAEVTPQQTDPTPGVSPSDDEPPCLWVLLWPELFDGSEAQDQKQVEVAVVELAAAGLIDVYLTRRWNGSESVRIVPTAQAKTISTQDTGSGTWVYQRLLAEAEEHRPGSFGGRLSHLRSHTRQTAIARGLLHAKQRDRFLPQPERVDPQARARAEEPARAAAQRWEQFVQSQPRVHRALIEATGLRGAVV